MGDRLNKNTPIRLFAAIIPSKSLVDGVFDLLGPCRKESWGKKVRWLPVANIHLTLRFFGDTLPGQRDALAVGMGDIVRDRSSFDVSLDSLIFLPHPRRTRVLAVSVKPGSPLDDLAESVENAARMCGFEPEERRFLGHLTVGRCNNIDFRGQKTSCDLSRLCMRVEGIELVQSTLTRHGAVYQSLTTFSFLD